jgi:hypothetical protein
MGELSKYLPRCLNCGRPLEPADDFCRNCGQRTRGTKVPLRDFISDFFQDYFTVDAKFFKSIFLLLAMPGSLTREFNEGKRKRYIAPFRMYLFTSFIYFFLLALSVDKNADGSFSEADTIDAAKAQILDSLVSNRIVVLDVDSLRKMTDSLERDFQGSTFLSIEDNDTTEVAESGSFSNRFERYIKNKAEIANEHPEAFIRSLLRSASITLFFLLPVFALILWAFHFKRGPYYVQHLVHSVHLHTFVFAVFSIYLGIGLAADVDGGLIVGLILLIYLIWSLRRVYRQSVFTAVIKSLLILLIYLFVILFTLIPAVLGALLVV